MVRRNYAQVSSSEADQNNDNNNEQSSYQHSSSSTSTTSAATATAITSEPDVEMSSRGRIGVRTSSSSSSSRQQRRQYSRLSISAGNEEETQALAASSTASTTAAETTTGLNTTSSSDTTGGLDDVNHASFSIDDEEDIDNGSGSGGGGFTVIILDVAQKKFSVTVPSSTSTIGDLKQAGYRVHKVPADRQRLIYRGKMLSNDSETLQEAGIVDDKVILHLFPKPRVVIKDSKKQNSFASSKQDSSVSNSTAGNENDDENNDDDNDSDDDDDDTGARVPTIVLDPDEAERRSQILVLGSSDYVEAQNNVKLFSFMLLIISTIELMTLLSVALGVQQEENNYSSRSSSSSNSGGLYPYDQDDVFNNLDDGDFRHNRTSSSSSSSSSSTYNDMRVDPSAVVYQQWTMASWFDLIISLLGVYVAILGIKASSESTLRLAQWYLAGTFVTGIGWMLWNFIMTYKIDVKINETRQANHNNSNNTDDFYYQNLDDDDIVWQAVSVMVLPGMVWFMCCLKAWQFQHLLSEAEQEAQERIRSEWSAMENAANGTTTTTTTSTTNTDADGATTTSDDPPPPPQHDEELALQNQSATLS